MYLLPSSQTTPDMYNPLPPTWLETMRYFMTANFPSTTPPPVKNVSIRAWLAHSDSMKWGCSTAIRTNALSNLSAQAPLHHACTRI